jgi:hypothetical protein
MHGNICGPLQQAMLQFLNEKALSTHFGQGCIQNLIATGHHLDQLYLKTRMQLFQTQSHVFSLP